MPINLNADLLNPMNDDDGFHDLTGPLWTHFTTHHKTTEHRPHLWEYPGHPLYNLMHQRRSRSVPVPKLGLPVDLLQVGMRPGCYGGLYGTDDRACPAPRAS